MLEWSFALRLDAAADFVEEVYHQCYVTLDLSRLGALRGHQHGEALAVGGEIEIHSQAEVRKPLSGPQPRFIRNKSFPFHRIIRDHDPLILSAVVELTPIPGPERHHPTGVRNLQLAAV